MKLFYSFTLTILVAAELQAALPIFSFRNPVLLSGTNLTVGARYRFSNVRTGTDAIVTINALTSGITLTSVDDGSAGYADAFQPYVVSPGNSNGYAEFRIEFVNTGTLVPRVMVDVPVTLVDIDGEPAPGPINEFDMVSLNPVSHTIDYDMVGTDLSITYTPTWVTGRNVASINYSGIDTALKRVMFTVVNTNISSFDIRLGATNARAASNNRRKSVYFDVFEYPNSFLPISVTSFTGTHKNQDITLSFSVAPHVKAVSIERGADGSTFSTIHQVNVGNSSTFTYRDNIKSARDQYYRLRVVADNGAVSYSNVLSFRQKHESKRQFSIYPTQIESSASMNIESNEAGKATLVVVDMSGRVMFEKSMNVEAGYSQVSINEMSKLRSGQYIAALKTASGSQSQQIYKK